MIVSFWVSAYFQGRLLAVSFREGRCNQPLSTLKAHQEAVPILFDSLEVGQTWPLVERLGDEWNVG